MYRLRPPEFSFIIFHYTIKAIILLELFQPSRTLDLAVKPKRLQAKLFRKTTETFTTGKNSA